MNKWTEEEIQYLKDNYGKVRSADLYLPGRTWTAIKDKANKLGLIGFRQWTDADVEYLEDSWGVVSIGTIAKNLNKSVNAVIIKAQKLDLGPFLDSGDYLTLNQLMMQLKGKQGHQYTIDNWIRLGLPVKKRRVVNKSFQIIYVDDWWDWAEQNLNMIDLSGLEPLALGAEPAWVESKRNADIEKTYFKTESWTSAEDAALKTLLNSYQYNYRELSLRLRRTEGAIKRRMIDLNIKTRPLKMNNHNPWTEHETNNLIDLYNQGHSASTMANYIDRSAQACSGKVERLIKEGILFPRSEARTSC